MWLVVGLGVLALRDDAETVGDCFDKVFFDSFRTARMWWVDEDDVAGD